MTVKWTDKLLHKEALKYNTRKEFRKTTAYYAARRRGIVDDICKHMTPKQIRWTRKTLHQEALKCNTRYEFKKNNPGAYSSAHRRKIFEDICSHMVTSPKRNKWPTKEIIHQEALKYNTRYEFCKSSGGAYPAARKLGILDDVCNHMTIMLHNWDEWNESLIRQEALKHKTRYEFSQSQNNGGAYAVARKLGILDDVCSHMKGDKWDEKKIYQEALKYDTKSEFRNNSGAYSAAHHRGILDDICSHMTFFVYSPSDLIYMWSSIERPDVWKIGISSVINVDDRIRNVASDAKFTVNESYHKQIKNPRQMEKMLLASGEIVDFGRKFDGHTEFRRLNDDELYSAKEIFGIA